MTSLSTLIGSVVESKNTSAPYSIIALSSSCDSISIEDICGNLNKLKKDHEATAKACLKAKKDKTSLHKLTEQHSEEIQKLKPYIDQLIQNKLKLEQKIFDLQWTRQFKEQELARAKSEISDESSINEALIDSYEVSLQSIHDELLLFKSRMEESTKMKEHLSEEILRQGNIFSSQCQEKRGKEVELREKMEETHHLHELLDSLEETYTALLKENVNRTSSSNQSPHSKSNEKLLLIEQQKYSDQLKNINNELRELRQKKQSLAQQIDSKKKLKEAMNEELKNLARELKSKGIGNNSDTRRVAENSSAADLTSPFSNHFSAPKTPAPSAQKFSFKRTVVNHDPQKISATTPDIRLLKRKTSPNENVIDNANQNNNSSRVDISSFAYKKNDFRKASDINSVSNSSNNSSSSTPTTYTFKKLKKD
ncbi:predicted protein [Naegleria gruberi]|uniref:Predicted protein n=1 Tax=Naegleria gruberi TaxID=5762 RepID=D2V7I3_NAEGR|nr:uncharacterized protein NAEGRDRAFT_47296 [Naegleria gruberi]EFC47256.1 predicted protein [Naegleria gruberi]|eukprot:XP_002680000.1 predicted protein [Naegleria gruberi strain NEG-M]